MGRLFRNDITPSDELYRICRDEDRCSRLKSHAEDLWDIYEPYADTDFPLQLPHDFNARFWEMYLACSLVRVSYDLVPKRTRTKGPDIQLRAGMTTIWVEAVAPTSGEPGKADSVPEPKMGVAQVVPDDQMTLRYCGAITYKYLEKYQGYVADGIVDKGDCYVIAVNGCRLGWHGGDREPPRIVRSVLPIGWQFISIDPKSGDTVGTGYHYRASIKKTSGSEVGTDLFVRTEFSGISAVMSSTVDIANPRSTMGEDFITVGNPLARSQLPEGFPRIGREYRVQLSEGSISWSSRVLGA